MITVVGDLMLDVYLLSDLQREEQGQGVLLRPGGSAANTAAWLAHLRSAVTFVGCVGADEVGSMLIRELQEHGVAPRVDVAGRLETGAVVVELTEQGERVMRSSRGANEGLSPNQILQAGADAPGVVHLTGYSLLGPHGLTVLEAAGELARRCSARLSFDPSSIGVVQRFGASALLEAVVRSGVDVLLPNAAEGAALAGGASVEETSVLLTSAVGTVLVKDGPEGAAWSASGDAGRVPTVPLVALDTTGAGDAFDAGALRSLEGGGSAALACAEGNHTAAVAIRRYGGRPPRTASRGPVA